MCVKIQSRMVCLVISLQYSYVYASNNLHYIQRQESYKDIATECRYEGDVLLMRQEPIFDDVLHSPEVPPGVEFWVGDLIYSNWILPLDCIKKSSIPDGNQNVKTTSDLLECYKHCSHYAYFAIEVGHCVCLDSYTADDSFPLKECNVSCTDMGLCGGTGPGKTKYVNVYYIQYLPEFPEIQVQSPNQIVDGYAECLTARCQTNQYTGVHCNSNIQKYGFCDSSYTAPRDTYNSALYSCAIYADVYYPGHCFNTTNGNAWVGQLRFSFSSEDGIDQYPSLNLARGAKCTKISDFEVNCIPTIENTKLPFVCKTGTQPSTSKPQISSTTSQPGSTTKGQGNDGGDNTVGIIAGCTVSVFVVCVTVVVVCYFKRKKNKDTNFAVEGINSQRRDPKSVYQIPKPAAETYDHVYAETTEVYHPYLELRDDGFSSLTSSENLVKSPSNQNSLATPTIVNGESNGLANNSTVMLTVDNEYVEPARTPNFGRKLPQIPSERM